MHYGAKDDDGQEGGDSDKDDFAASRGEKVGPSSLEKPFRVNLVVIGGNCPRGCI